MHSDSIHHSWDSVFELKIAAVHYQIVLGTPHKVLFATKQKQVYYWWRVELNEQAGHLIIHFALMVLCDVIYMLFIYTQFYKWKYKFRMNEVIGWK